LVIGQQSMKEARQTWVHHFSVSGFEQVRFTGGRIQKDHEFDTGAAVFEAPGKVEGDIGSEAVTDKAIGSIGLCLPDLLQDEVDGSSYVQ
jgi:hypothetical protein